MIPINILGHIFWHAMNKHEKIFIFTFKEKEAKNVTHTHTHKSELSIVLNKCLEVHLLNELVCTLYISLTLF